MQHNFIWIPLPGVGSNMLDDWNQISSDMFQQAGQIFKTIGSNMLVVAGTMDGFKLSTMVGEKFNMYLCQMTQVYRLKLSTMVAETFEIYLSQLVKKCT